MSTAVVTALKTIASVLMDEENRKKLGWIIAMVLSPLIIIICFICVMASGSADHNVKAIDLSFNGGYIGNKVPADYKEYITDMRTSFSKLDQVIGNANSEMEDGDALDTIRVKSVFYALYFGEDTPSNKDHTRFVSCFYYEEERTREVESTSTVVNDDGTTSTETTTETETYIVYVPFTDMSVVYSNIESTFGITITHENKANANEIYYRITYGKDFGAGGTLTGINSIPLSGEPFVGMDGFTSPIGGDWQSTVSSEFGARPWFTKDPFHTGIDFGHGGVTHGTPIYSALDGVVSYTRHSSTGFGNHIVIDHGGGIITLYAHCSTLLVTDGQQVKAGDLIAKVGTTGLSTGNHLHFEVRENGTSVNPRKYLPTTNSTPSADIVEQNINFTDYPSTYKPKSNYEILSL